MKSCLILCCLTIIFGSGSFLTSLMLTNEFPLFIFLRLGSFNLQHLLTFSVFVYANLNPSDNDSLDRLLKIILGNFTIFITTELFFV